MLSSGLRNHRVRVERRSIIDDGYGNTRDAWGLVVERWCAVKLPPRGSERQDAGETTSMENWSLTILRESETRNIRSEDRVIFASGPHAGRGGAVVAVRAANDGREMQIDVVMNAPT